MNTHPVRTMIVMNIEGLFITVKTVCNNLIKDKTAPHSKQITLNVLETLVENEKFLIFMGNAPNGGKCPNCPTGRLSYDPSGLSIPLRPIKFQASHSNNGKVADAI